jgi:hypothetical protein
LDELLLDMDGERIKSERSEQMTSEVSYGNDFDERDEADLDADVELYTDDIKSSQDVATAFRFNSFTAL